MWRSSGWDLLAADGGVVRNHHGAAGAKAVGGCADAAGYPKEQQCALQGDAVRVHEVLTQPALGRAQPAGERGARAHGAADED